MSHERRITGAATIISAATAASRVLGYVRDAVLAYVFGAGVQADAFFTAFRISNLLRRLVGEGALTSAFIPIFTEEMNTRSKEGLRELASSVFTLFALILTFLTVLGVIFSEDIVRLMAPGFLSDPEKFSLTVTLTRWMFPYMVFIGLMAIAMGVLHSHRHFTAPALAPIFLNISMITSVLVIAPFISSPAYALVGGVLAGGLFQLMLQLPFLKRFDMLPTLSFRWEDQAIKRIFFLMGPAALGIAVYQINLFVGIWFASPLPGAVSYLYYAGRLMELPLGIFAVSISTAILPSLSEQVAKEDWAGVKKSLSFAVRLVNFVTIPATIGLLVLSYPIVELLFQRGEFTAQDSSGTAIAVFYYALGLVPIAAARILVSVFYSLKNIWTPVKVSVAIALLNAFLCYVLVGPLAHGGLALASTLSAAVNCAVLFVILRMKFGRFGIKEMLTSGVKSTAASVVMGIIVYFIAFEAFDVTGTTGKVLVVALCVGLGLLSYVAAARLMGVNELAFLKGFLKR